MARTKVSHQTVYHMLEKMSAHEIDHDHADRILDLMMKGNREEWYNRRGWTNEQVLARVINLTEQAERRIGHETGCYSH